MCHKYFWRSHRRVSRSFALTPSGSRFQAVLGVGIGQNKSWGIEARESFCRGFDVEELDETRPEDFLVEGFFSDCP